MLRPGHAIALCVLALLTIGLVMVSSAGMDLRLHEASRGDTLAAILTQRLLSRETAYMAMAMLALILTSLLPVRSLAGLLRAAPPDDDETPARTDVIVLGIATLVLLAVLALSYLPGLGREVNGSYRWIRFTVPGLGEQSAQPSEVVKWGILFVLGWFAARRAAHMRSILNGLVPALAALGLLAAAVALEDLGTGVLIGAAGTVLILAAGARLWPFLLLTPVAGVLLGAFILMSPYRVERVKAFVDPWRDPEGTGYHMIQSMMAIAGGEGFGRGLGAGIQKFGYLPEDRTDFLFAVICEELGIAGAAIVICLYMAIVWAGLGIARRVEGSMVRLVGLGVVATLGMQAVMNMAVVTGVAPTKGIALPLVSAGGTGWVLTSAMLGLLIAMDRAEASREEAGLAQVEPKAVGIEPGGYADLEEDDLADDEYECEDAQDEPAEHAMIRA